MTEFNRLKSLLGAAADTIAYLRPEMFDTAEDERLFDARLIELRVASRILPPDPDRRNDKRAEFAQAALDAYRAITGSDATDAPPDLLGDLMHWADRHGDFEDALERARQHYAAETGQPGPLTDGEGEARKG
jgi:hypothetical protein